MTSHTDRQMLLWNAWGREDLEVPEKNEFYLMQLAAEVRVLREQVACLFGGKGREVKIADFKMSFRDPDEVKVLSPERVAQIGQQVHLSRTTSEKMPPVLKRMSKREAAEMVEKTRKEWEDYGRRNGT